MRQNILPALLAFNGGFADAAGYFGLDGLFTAHVTGNFVTLGATLIAGAEGVLSKILALPEFMVVVGLTQLISAALVRRQRPALRLLLALETLLLLAFFGLAVGLGPFAHSDTPAALLTGFAGVAAMAVQNAVQRLHFAAMPPMTIMTGNTTQAVLDAVDLLRGPPPAQAPAVRARLGRTLQAILCFAAGCALAAWLQATVGFWSLGVAVLVGTATLLVPLPQ